MEFAFLAANNLSFLQIFQTCVSNNTQIESQRTCKSAMSWPHYSSSELCLAQGLGSITQLKLSIEVPQNPAVLAAEMWP
jgi:hypothetical protein